MATLAFATWSYRDSELVRRFWPGGLPALPALATTPNKTAGSSASQAISGLRKCRSGATVAYTDGACPPGSREEAMASGTLTVVPARRPAQGPTQEPAKPQSVLRSLSGGEPGDLQRKHIEREVGP